MRLDGPPTWTMKKLTKEIFVDILGRISASARFVFQRRDDSETILTNCLGILVSELLARTCMFGTTLILASSNSVGATEQGTKRLH